MFEWKYDIHFWVNWIHFFFCGQFNRLQVYLLWKLCNCLYKGGFRWICTILYRAISQYPKEDIIWSKHAHILTLVLFILPTCTHSSVASVISIQTICSAWEMDGFTRVWRMLVVIYGLAFTHRFVCLNSQQLHPEYVPAQNWKEWLNHQSILTLCHWKKTG